MRWQPRAVGRHGSGSSIPRPDRALSGSLAEKVVYMSTFSATLVAEAVCRLAAELQVLSRHLTEGQSQPGDE